jgi:hypothetical protein
MIILEKCSPCIGLWDDRGNIYCRYEKDTENCCGPQEESHYLVDKDDERFRKAGCFNSGP